MKDWRALLAVTATSSVLLGAKPASKEGTIDCEGHLIGAHGSRRSARSAAAAAVETMDSAGIGVSVVMPPPQRAGQPVGYPYTKLIPAVRAYPDRLVFLAGGGILNPMIRARGEVTPEIRTEFRRLAEKSLSRGARGFGEMSALHLSFNDRHMFEEVAPDHELFLLLADIAAEHGVPINLHMEAVKRRMPTPRMAKQRSLRNPSHLKPNIAALERLLAHNRGTRIIWAHAGWDSTGDRTVGLQRRLLREHPNLILSLKVMRERWPRPNKPVDSDGRIRPSWLALIEDFPDRFIMASDQFHQGDVGRSAMRFPQHIPETSNLIEQLPSALRDQVGRENAEKLFRL